MAKKNFLGPKKSFGSKTVLGTEKFCVQKNLGLKKNFKKKNVGSEWIFYLKKLSQKGILAKKMGPQKTCVKKMLCRKKNFWSKKSWVLKTFMVEKKLAAVMHGSSWNLKLKFTR